MSAARDKQDLTIDDLLDDWEVYEPGIWENECSKVLDGWWAVADKNGIVAYFEKEADAFRFRLAEINRVLNG